MLVVGSGIAGLFAAVKAHDAGTRVLMVSKGRLGSSGMTPFAKGIFAYDPAREKLSLDEFVDRVSRSAMGTNNPVFTRQMAEHSLDRVKELKEWGFFDSPLYFDAFSRPIKKRNIPVIERVMVTHLIKEKERSPGPPVSASMNPGFISSGPRASSCAPAPGDSSPTGFPSAT